MALVINSTTGEIDLSASTAGTYTVTYTVAQDVATTQVTINTTEDSSFSYRDSSYSQDDTDPIPTITGLTGGTFSGTTGLVINSTTGEIDLSASSILLHTVTYTTNGPCPSSTTFDVGITAGFANTYSVNFDGVNDYADTNYTFPAINTWSYSYWVNITNPSNNNYFYHVTARNSSTTGLVIWSGDGSVSSQRNFSVRMENSTTMTFSVSSFNTWYHIVVTGDGSNLTAYVDGSQAATVAASTLFSTLTYTTKIGSNKDFTNYFLNGKIDETAIFNTALTAAQVLEIYNNGQPSNLDNFSGTAPISWWRMGENNGGTGTTISNEGTGSSNNMILYNGANITNSTP